MSGTTLNATGGGGGVPGGSNTQIQYNNAGAFGGIATATYTVGTGALSLASGGTNQNLTLSPSGTGTTNISSNPGGSGRNSVAFTNTNGTSKSSQFTYYSNATPLWSFGNDSSTNGLQDFYIYDNSVGISRLYFGAGNANGGPTNFPLLSVVGWGSPSGPPITADTGLARNAAGVVEVNNGTAGTFRDAKVRTVIHNGQTVATLPTGVAGMVAYVTDGTAALAWGATATGGGTTPYLVWYNGTNWTVVGK
jgi:hypothetical protein